jgi:surface polysaccharide O-acyltransferase-like enzyme
MSRHTCSNVCAGVFVSDTFFTKIGCVWFLSNRYIAVRQFLFGVSPVVIFVVVAVFVVVYSLCTRKRLGHYQNLDRQGNTRFSVHD